MTYREGIAQVRSRFKLHGSDIVITDRAILAELRNTSIEFILQRLNKKQFFDSEKLFVSLPPIELEPVPLAETCDYVSDCMIARSKLPLPETLESPIFGATRRVYTIDKRKEFLKTTPTRYSNMMKLEDVPRGLYHWVQDSYLYVTDISIDTVFVKLIPKNDVDFSIYNCDPEEDCCPNNPLDADIFSGDRDNPVIDVVSDMILRDYKRSKEDIGRDDIDSSK